MGLSQTMLRPVGVRPNARNSHAAWDPSRPDTIGLYGARKLGNGKYFSTPVDEGQNRPLCLAEGATSTAFWSWWMRLDYNFWLNTPTSSNLNGKYLFGVFNPASNRWAWAFYTTSTAANGTLRFLAGNNTLGTTSVDTGNIVRAGDGSTTNMFGDASSGSSAAMYDTWHHCAAWYNGALFGDNTAVFKFWFNGVLQTTPAGSNLPQKFGRPAAGNNVALHIGTPISGGFGWSVMDWMVSASLPADADAAVAALYGAGVGKRYATHPAAAPTPLAYYQGDDNYSATTGAAPSDSMANLANPGTYDLAMTGSVEGENQVGTWTDRVGGKVAVFGYTPSATNGRRSYWGIFKPTARNGKPCVYVRPTVGNTGPKGGYARAPFENLHTTMGAAGSLIGNGIVGYKGAITSDTDLFGVYDDYTGTGSSGTDRVLSLTLISYNAYSNPVSVGTCTFTTPSAGVALTVNRNSHGLSDGDYVWITSSGGEGPAFLPAPLNAAMYFSSSVVSSLYRVKNAAANSLQLALAATNPLGSAILSTDGSAGSGTFTLWKGPYSQTVCAQRLSLFSKSGTGTPDILYSDGGGNMPVGREYNHKGIELNGIAVAGATYPALGEEFTLEAANRGDGAQAVHNESTPTPFEMWCNGVLQPICFHDDGAAGNKANYWGSTYPYLSAIGIGAMGGVSTAGVSSAGQNQNEIYFGPLVIAKNCGPSARAGLRRWAATV